MAKGSAHWEADYTFSATKRKVHNVVDARFELRDGLIVKHTDVFDFGAGGAGLRPGRCGPWGGPGAAVRHAAAGQPATGRVPEAFARQRIIEGCPAGRHRLLTISAAIAVGVLVALQSRINAELSQYVGGGVIAAAVSFGTGLVLAWVIVSSRAPLRASVAALPGLLRDRRLKWWQVLGGLGGAWFVTTQGLVVPATGVTVFTIGVVAGQVTGSLLVDRAGLRSAGHLPISGGRVVAAVVALAAVVVSGLHRGLRGVVDRRSSRCPPDSGSPFSRRSTAGWRSPPVSRWLPRA